MNTFEILLNLRQSFLERVRLIRYTILRTARRRQNGMTSDLAAGWFVDGICYRVLLLQRSLTKHYNRSRIVLQVNGFLT